MHSAKRPQASNLTIRVITGLVIFPVISVAILLGGWVLSILLGILAVIGVLEFSTCGGNKRIKESPGLGSYSPFQRS
ncbi:hypothetical protein MASR2M15_29390 [Anaerolineales bacterium]